MSIYIQDDKKHTVRYYATTSKIEKAIDTLLQADADLMYSETHEGYAVTIIEMQEEIRQKARNK